MNRQILNYIVQRQKDAVWMEIDLVLKDNKIIRWYSNFTQNYNFSVNSKNNCFEFVFHISSN